MITLTDGATTLELLGTVEAAHALGLSPQTLRQWACEGRGPIKPNKAYGRLFWPRADVERLASTGGHVKRP